MLGGVDSEPGSRPGRRWELSNRLEAVRARLRGAETKTPARRYWTRMPATGWKRPGAMRPRRTLPPHERWPAAWRRSARRPTLTSVPPACTRMQRRPGSAMCTSTSGRRHFSGMLPPMTGSGPNAPSRSSPIPDGRLPLSPMSAAAVHRPPARADNQHHPHSIAPGSGPSALAGHELGDALSGHGSGRQPGSAGMSSPGWTGPSRCGCCWACRSGG